MRSILEELFYGNICPNTDCRSRSKETKQLMAYIAKRPFRLYFRKGSAGSSPNDTPFFVGAFIEHTQANTVRPYLCTCKKSGIKRFPISIYYDVFYFLSGIRNINTRELKRSIIG